MSQRSISFAVVLAVAAGTGSYAAHAQGSPTLPEPSAPTLNFNPSPSPPSSPIPPLQNTSPAPRPTTPIVLNPINPSPSTPNSGTGSSATVVSNTESNTSTKTLTPITPMRSTKNNTHTNDEVKENNETKPKLRPRHVQRVRTQHPNYDSAGMQRMTSLPGTAAGLSQPVYPLEPIQLMPVAPLSSSITAPITVEHREHIHQPTGIGGSSGSIGAPIVLNPPSYTNIQPHTGDSYKSTVLSHPATTASKMTSPVSNDQYQDEWIARKGQKLSMVLKNWGRQAGWDVVWDAGYDFTLKAGASFQGDFVSAASELIGAFENASPPIEGEFNKRNRSLHITSSDNRDGN